MDHETLVRQYAVIDPATGILWAIDTDNLSKLKIIALPDDISPDYRNLLFSSLLLYRTIAEVETGLEELLGELERIGGDRLVHAVAQFQAALNVARKCAIEGVDKIALKRK